MSYCGNPVDENGATTAPLAQYAAMYWVTHAQVKNIASRIRDGMDCLFDPDRPYFTAWVKLYDQRRWVDDLHHVKPLLPTLFVSIVCPGFTNLSHSKNTLNTTRQPQCHKILAPYSEKVEL